MYSDSAIRFRDPFAISKNLSPPKTHSWSQHPSRTSWSAQPRCQDFSRALTPPPEMTGVHSASSKPIYPLQDHDRYHADCLPVQQPNRPSAASYLQPETVSSYSTRHSVTTHVTARGSPIRQTLADCNGDSQPRRGTSHSRAIAANLQIPRSVNESGGNLAELAAQITCLFWFESAELLQQIEDSQTPFKLPRALIPDARPTTGFRKWVITILSTTMVAQNVVVLALLFIHRLKKLNPAVRGKPGSEYRLLTVALMLGNKFLDDNTYTNKTWAEVSGINVGEVHIMEVEFLSNMKYCLFTSEQDWAHWQALLGSFAAFFERASRPQPPAPILPPASSLYLPIALPSPPVSTNPTSSFTGESATNAMSYNCAAGQHGPTPAPSPLGTHVDAKPVLNPFASRKRSQEDYSTDPPAKRIATGYPSYTPPPRHSAASVQPNQSQAVQRLTLPSLAIPATQVQSAAYTPTHTQGQQLPPLSVPARAMGIAYPGPSSQNLAPQLPATAAPSSHVQQTAQFNSRHQSPYAGSAATSPSNSLPQLATALHPAHQISPTHFLQQRSSPYRPVHHVSTLLYPPPSAAMQTRPLTVELSQMQYQPLGKPVQHTGRLPYVSQNMWLDGHHPQEMTPIYQWPGMSVFVNNQHQEQHVVPQQH